MDRTHLYPFSAEEARRRDELSLWRASHQANIACKEAIEASIRRDFDGTRLKDGCLDEVLRRFGYRRTAWVLANTLQQKDWDGRFRQSNLQWAAQTRIPQEDHNSDFVVESHPAVLDGFVTRYREAYQALGLFGPKQCAPQELDYQDRVLVLSPDTLKESCWSPQNQLWYAHDGFGCSPTAIGRSIRCTCLGDGEIARWDRTDFLGVLKEEALPEWAQDKLVELGLRPPPIDRAALEARLKEKVTAEWTSYQARLEAMPAKELIVQAEEIAASRFCFCQLTENACLCPTDLLTYLDSLETPLQDLSERWAAWQEGGSMEELEQAIASLQAEQREERAAGPVQKDGADLEMG